MALSTPASDTSLAPVVLPREGARGSSLYRDAWRRLLRNRLAVAGGAVVILLCLIAIFADVIAPQSYTKANFGHLYESPNREFPLGTDQLGRDVLSRLIYGARVSMLVGLGAQVIIVLIGVPIGALSGYIGGRTDLLLTRFVDVMYAFPRLLFVILVMSMLGAGLINIFIALGLTGWVGIARQTRAQVLSIKEKEFVEGARALHRGRPVVHRRRHQPAHPLVGADGGGEPAVPPLLLAPLCLSRDRHRGDHALVHLLRRRGPRRPRSQAEVTHRRISHADSG
jgi:ABC-type dipeptide/oligopeptide/nickel transport system permease subunit